MVVCDEAPLPPLEALGLSELLESEPAQLRGIAYIDTIFVTERSPPESLLFHELVHIVQWNALGPDNFLMVYGLGLLEHGYRDSYLETMAYDFQRRFDAGGLAENLEADIRSACEQHWKDLNQRFGRL